MSDSQISCRVCRNTDGNTAHRVREMLHGTLEEYDYVQCGNCGCLQLAVIPEDLSQFYPEDYCCHKDYIRRTRNTLRRIVDSAYVRASLPTPGPLSRVADVFHPGLDYLRWMQYAGLDTSSRILDVGCGTGKLLIRMSLGGFKTLDGIDPFISDDISAGSVRIRRISTADYIAENPEPYDMVMLHHAFEHVPDPWETLRQLESLLKPGGCLLIRIPVADCYSREHYQEAWYSWDAPRHTFLHTSKSMQYLAEKCGYVIRKIEHDATWHQLRNSELYRKGIPATRHSEAFGQFSRDQILKFQEMSDQLNREHRGEQAAFYLQRADSVPTSARAA